MPSYAITGTSRGLGVCFYSTFVSFHYSSLCSQLGFVEALSADPSNTVFALARNVSAAEQLNDFVAHHAHKNVYVIEADNNNQKSLQVSYDTIDVSYSLTAARMPRVRSRRSLAESWTCLLTTLL